MTFDESRREQKPRTLMQRGVEALARREYSREELYRKLSRGLLEGETLEDVTEVVDALVKRGYLSDERYASGRVRSRAPRYGNRRLAAELTLQGVDSETIRGAIEEAEPEIDRARVVWERRFGDPPEDYKDKCRQVRFMAARGFSFDVINRVLSEAGDRMDEVEE